MGENFEVKMQFSGGAIRPLRPTIDEKWSKKLWARVRQLAGWGCGIDVPRPINENLWNSTTDRHNKDVKSEKKRTPGSYRVGINELN